MIFIACNGWELMNYRVDLCVKRQKARLFFRYVYAFSVSMPHSQHNMYDGFSTIARVFSKTYYSLLIIWLGNDSFIAQNIRPIDS